MRLKDKVALITGAGSGIGRQSALLFSKEGADILAVDVNEQAAAETVGMIRQAGARAVAFRADVSKARDCQQMVAASYSGGSGFLRFVKASVFGVVTAAAAAAAWIAITVAREGRISGIVAIGVAFLIGGAVRLGSGRRGGIAYQLLAMFITYLAIAATLTVYELRAPDGPKVESGAGWGLLVAFGLTVGPIIEGVSSPILGFIIAISLWEAWRLNRKQRITFNGPYRVGAPAGAAANAAQPYPTPPMYPPPPPGAWPPPTGGA